MIPIRDANPTLRRPWITIAFIVANVAVFLLWQPTFADEGEQQAFFFCHAQISWEVSNQENLSQGGAPAREALDETFGPGAGSAIQPYLQRTCPGKGWLASIFVSMFLHGGWLHIAGNMLFLWVFGNNVEDRLGPVGFVLFYIVGGLAAMLLHLAFEPSSAVPSVGASGAIAAVLGAYLVLFPRARITTLVFFFIITWIELPAAVVLIAWFVFQVFSGVGGLASELSGGVAYWAHVGGFAFGAAAAWLLFRGRRSPLVDRPLPPRPDTYL